MNVRGNISRTLTSVTLCFGLMVGLGGCRHKAQVAPMPPVLSPVAVEDIPEPENLPIVEAPQIKLPPVPYASNAGRPRPERRKPKVAPVPEPAPVTIVAPPEKSPEETAIGALTAGGEANPQSKQEAADLIASIEKRLSALSPQKAEESKAQVSQVKNFRKDAQDALKSGDAEGAKTLATKAKLLLDDLEK